jgi:hypothetical protein
MKSVGKVDVKLEKLVSISTEYPKMKSTFTIQFGILDAVPFMAI